VDPENVMLLFFHFLISKFQDKMPVARRNIGCHFKSKWL